MGTLFELVIMYKDWRYVIERRDANIPNNKPCEICEVVFQNAQFGEQYPRHFSIQSHPLKNLMQRWRINDDKVMLDMCMRWLEEGKKKSHFMQMRKTSPL